MIRCSRVFVASCLAVGLALTAPGCGKSGKGGSEPANLPSSNLPDSYWLKAEPSGAKPVAEVREKAKTGDPVVVAGIVGGTKEPFTDGVAAFTLIDKGAKPCTPDECPTPWDFCCEPPDKLTKEIVVVEFRDPAQGSPLKTSARGFHGLDHLKHVVVAGEAKKDEAGNVVVVAKGIFIGN